MTADYELYQPDPPDGQLSLDTQRAVTAVKARSAKEIVKAHFRVNLDVMYHYENSEADY